MSFLYPLLYGPTGRQITVDASGRLIINANVAADSYVLGYGSTGRYCTVDGSGRLLISALSQGLGGGGVVQNGANLGTGSGWFMQLNGSNLEFRSIKAGANIAITGTDTDLTISAGSGLGSAPGEAVNITVTDASGFYTTDNVEAALAQVGQAQYDLDNAGFVGWFAPIWSDYYQVSEAGFTVMNAGHGFIRGKHVVWASGQTTGAIASGTTNFIYMDETGTIGKTATWSEDIYRNNIALFEVFYDGTNFVVVRENHPYSMNLTTSLYLHEHVGTVIAGAGANVSRVAVGTGASADDRRLKIVTADEIDDHGVETDIPAINPITWNIFYKNGLGKWIRGYNQSNIPMVYNNAGTPTALGSIPAKYAIYTLYVTKDDIKSTAPQYIAVMGATQHSNITSAEAAISAGTNAKVDGNLAALEPAQLGYIIVQNNVDGGYIYEIIIAKSSVANKYVAGTAAGTAVLTTTSLVEFNNILSAADVNVQLALDTLDNHTHATSTDFANASGVWEAEITALQAVSGLPIASDITIVDGSGFYAGTDVETALQETGELEWYKDKTGVLSTSLNIATAMQNGSGLVGVTTGGQGYIRGQKVSFAAQSGVAGVASGTTQYFYIDTAGLLQSDNSPSSFSDYRDKMYLARAWCDGTNILASLENHPYNFPASVSWYLHKNPGTTVRVPGGDLTRVAEGSGVATDDRRLKISAATLDDHGLEADMPATNPVVWNIAYTKDTGKWKIAATQSELLMQYNNAGTPTALGAGKYGLYRFYAAFPQNTGDNCHYIAVMDDAQYDNLSAAQSALTNNSHSAATAELATMAPAQLGSAIIYKVNDGYVYSITISKDTFFTKTGGGNEGQAALVGAETAGFDGILSAADSNVQLALETIDDHSHAVETDFPNASGIWQSAIDANTLGRTDFINSSGNISGNLTVEDTIIAASGRFTNGIQVGAGSLHMSPDGSISAPGWSISANGDSTLQSSLDFANASGNITTDIAANNAAISSLQTDFTNSSGVFGGTILRLNGDQIVYFPGSVLSGSLVLGNGGKSLTNTAGIEGYYNTLAGIAAGQFLTKGYNNTLFGYHAGQDINTGYYNVCIGGPAGGNINTGFANVAIGTYAAASLTTGSENIIVGGLAGYSLTGNKNTVLGRSAGRNLTTASGNIVIGWNAGQNQQGILALQTPVKSIYIGERVRGKANTDSNAIVIGAEAVGSGTNTVVIGNNLTTNTYLHGNVFANEDQLIESASNQGAGSGLYSSKSGSILQFRSISAGTDVALSGSATEIRISVNPNSSIRTDFDNASGVWTANIATATGEGLDFANASGNMVAATAAAQSQANGVRTDFDNASGVWAASIAAAEGEDLSFLNASGNMVAATAAAQTTANGVRTDFDNASGVWTAAISAAEGEDLSFLNASGNLVSATAAAQAVADGVRVDLDNASGVWTANIATNTSSISSLQTDFTNASGNISNSLIVEKSILVPSGIFASGIVVGEGGNVIHIDGRDIVPQINQHANIGSSSLNFGSGYFSNLIITNANKITGLQITQSAGDGAYAQRIDSDNATGALYIDKTNTGPGIHINNQGAGQALFIVSSAGSSAAISASGRAYVSELFNQYWRRVSTVPNGSLNLNLKLGNYWDINLDNDCTINFMGGTANYNCARLTLVFTQASGNNTVAWPSNIIWADGTVPTISAASGSTTMIHMVYNSRLAKFIAEVNKDELGGGGTVQGATNLGTGSGLYAQLNGTNLEFKSISAGTNIAISGSATELRISSTGAGAGEANTASNLGTGAGLYSAKDGVDLQFKSLVAGNGADITAGATEITIGLLPSGTIATYNTGSRSVNTGQTDQHTVLTPSLGSAIREGVIGKITLTDGSSIGAGDVTVKIYNDFARTDTVYERVFDLAQTPLTDYLPAYFISASGGAMYFDIANNTGSNGNFTVEARCSTVLSVATAATAAGSGVTSDSAGDGLTYTQPRLDLALTSNGGLELTGSSPNKTLNIKTGDGVSTDSGGLKVDATVVRTTGSQNIAGVKRFTDHSFGVAPHPTSGPPSSGTYKVGDFFMDSNKIMYQCTAAGTPGTWSFWGWYYSQSIELGESAGNDNATYTATVSAGSSLAISLNTGVPSGCDGGRRGVIRKLNIWGTNVSHASGTIDEPFRVRCFPNENYFGREEIWSIQGQARKTELTGTETGGVDNVIDVNNIDVAAPGDLVRLRRKAATVGEEYARIAVRRTSPTQYDMDEAVLNDLSPNDNLMVVTEIVDLPWQNNSSITTNRHLIFLKVYNDGDTDMIFGYQADIETMGGGPAIG